MRRASIQAAVAPEPVLASQREPPSIEAYEATRDGDTCTVCIVTALRNSNGWAGPASWVFVFRAGACTEVRLSTTATHRMRVPPCRAPGLVMDLAQTLAQDTSR